MSEKLICPRCENLLPMKCNLLYDDDYFDILGVFYLIKCIKCDHIFISPLRKGNKYNIDTE